MVAKNNYVEEQQQKAMNSSTRHPFFQVFACVTLLCVLLSSTTTELDRDEEAGSWPARASIKCPVFCWEGVL
uniref:Uncharacterized protein n=1 Tax=Caenorhabditis tropicalis TaxID=1561998 RepID=A0A1I7TZH5_9PELO